MEDTPRQLARFTYRPGMYISGREAATILARVGLSREGSRGALAGGLAGDPIRLKGSLLYEEQRVRELAARPHTKLSDLSAHCRRGTFVARLNPLAPPPIGPGWYVSPWARAWIHHAISTVGYYPFVATISGYVVEGAEIIGAHPHLSGTHVRTSFTTRSAGEWFHALEGSRFRTGPGGPWLIWRAPPPFASTA